MMNHLVAIVGPTGVGKSKLALRLAQDFDGEIVSADSRQVYRCMDIGTAKPSPEELAFVRHHLINIVNHDEAFNLAQYQELAYVAIKDIQQRDKLPLLVGGSGLYIWAVLEGWNPPRVSPDAEFRRYLEKKAAETGKEELFHELMKVDPVAAQRIDPANVRRVIRALEVHQSAGVPFSQLEHKKTPPFEARVIGLTMDRQELYHRIDTRIDKMLEQGLVEEVKNLVNMGYDFSSPAMSGIGYKQVDMFLKGELSLEAAIQQIKFETHRLVRHQYNWFRLEDKRINWFDMQSRTESEIVSSLVKFLQSKTLLSA